MSDASTIRLLTKFAAGWNAHDVDMLLECMTEDAVFYSSVGPELDGAVVKGIAALRDAFTSLWLSFPDAAWNDVHHIPSDEYAITTWRFSGTNADGSSVNVRGCDIFQINNGKIAVKDTFRKQVIGRQSTMGYQQ